MPASGLIVPGLEHDEEGGPGHLDGADHLHPFSPFFCFRQGGCADPAGYFSAFHSFSETAHRKPTSSAFPLAAWIVHR